MRLGCVTLTSRDASAHADFYRKLLGWEIRFENISDGFKFVGIVGDTHGRILFQEDDDYVEAVWPTEPGKQQMQMHLDFHTDDLERDAAHALACGAKLADTQYSEKWRIFIDPAGHPFCIEQMPDHH